MNGHDLSWILDRAILGPLVQRLLQNSTVEIRDWFVQPVHIGDGESLGVYRIAGSGQDQQQSVSWSLILKVFSTPAEGGAEGDWNDW